MKSYTLCLLLLIVTSVATAEPRTWTDSTGTYKVQAEFVEFKDGNAVLLREDGRKVSVPVAKLSKADQDFVRAELRRRRSESNKPTVTPKPAPGANMVDGEWPQWRGPNRDGVSTEKGLLDRWDADGPPLFWSTRGAGSGYSSVS
ncbi:MAG: hypothetical protein IH991_08660, partial [Planctomycetes bacterium]|nr:hypothetical protein [Planctomycetota bacterium]